MKFKIVHEIWNCTWNLGIVHEVLEMYMKFEICT